MMANLKRAMKVEYTLNLSEDEASLILSVLSRVSQNGSPAANLAYEIYDMLSDEHLPEYDFKMDERMIYFG